MKYWLFDGSDVVGPFTPQELAARPGFAPTSLVCPENTSDQEDSWKMASAFEELATTSAPAEEELDTDTFDKEMDTLLKERSPLSEPQEPPTEPPSSLQMPQKPAKPGPIEDYFNNMQGGDLGNILGIPDPNENSDMNLARALAKQFNKTTPPADKVVDKDPFDEFTGEPEEEPQAKVEPAPAAPTQEQPVPPPAPVQEKEPEPASIPISAEPEEKMELTVHGAKTQILSDKPAPEEAKSESAQAEAEPEQEVQPAQEAEPKLTETKPTEPTEQKNGQTEAELEAAPMFTLPVVDQPESELPPMPQGPVETAEPLLTDEIPAPTVDEHAPVTEAPAQPSQDEPEISAEEPVTPPADQPAPAPQETKAEPDPATTIVLETPDEPADDQEGEVQELPKPNTEPVEDILVGSLKVKATPEIQEPIKSVPIMPEVNQVRPRLKPTPEIQQFLTDTQNERIAATRNNKKAMAALAVLVALIALGLVLMFNQAPADGQKKTAQNAPVSPELVPEEKTISATDQEILLPAPPPAVKPQTVSAADKALSAVQNYTLSGGRGTVAAYLDRLYRNKLSHGYTGNWSAEPLHKNAYIVKYRLTKTRMEPIVYVFQADVSKGTLTGALNNVALDLLGKIQ
ncbi:hypothetical protein [Candidatus Avelusimicrobium stercoris]|uniref:hypothetical protein n=1 Tax=Candidatus Avelusimicrobium stercoris TaxID=1947924 RepID=UPI003D0C5902